MSVGRRRSPAPTLTAVGRHAGPSAPRRDDDTRLGELLVAAGVTSTAQVSAARAAQERGEGKALGRLLLERGAVSEADLTRVLASQYNLGQIDLRSFTPDP